MEKIELKQAGVFAVQKFRDLEQRLRDNDTTRRLTFAGIQNFDVRTDLGPYQGISYYMPSLGLGVVTALAHRFGANAMMFQTAWQPNLDPRGIVVNGRRPDVIGFSGMSIHYADLVRKSRQLAEMGEDRPLTISGGHQSIYEPWKGLAAGADIAISGEASTFLEFMAEAVEEWTPGMSFRRHVLEGLRGGAYNHVRGLNYLLTNPGTGEVFMVETGRPYLLTDTTVLPRRLSSLSLLERKHKESRAIGRPVPPDKLRDNGVYIFSVQTTSGCSEDCDFCPLPEVNSGLNRTRNPVYSAEEIAEVFDATGLNSFFGTGDNEGMNPKWLREWLTALAEQKTSNGLHLAEAGLRGGSEITMKALARNLDLFPLMGEGPAKEWWVGQESFNNPGEAQKGQSLERVVAVHCAAAQHGIGIHWMTIKFPWTPYTTKESRPEDAYARQLIEQQLRGREQQRTLYETISRLDPDTDSGQIIELSRGNGLRARRNVFSPEWQELAPAGNGLFTVTGIEDGVATDRYMANILRAQAASNLMRSGSHDDISPAELARYRELPGFDETLERARALKGEMGYYGDKEEVQLCLMLGGRYGGLSLQRLILTLSTGSNIWLEPYEAGTVVGRLDSTLIGDYHIDGNRAVIINPNDPHPERMQIDTYNALKLFYHDQGRSQMLKEAASRSNGFDPEARAYRLWDLRRKKQLTESGPMFQAHIDALSSGDIEWNTKVPDPNFPVISLDVPEYPYHRAELYRIEMAGQPAKLFVFPGQQVSMNDRELVASK